MGRRLGQPGEFGYAQEVTHKKTGEKRAVKVINKLKFQDSQLEHFQFVHPAKCL